jgi:hypothetical protein
MRLVTKNTNTSALATSGVRSMQISGIIFVQRELPVLRVSKRVLPHHEQPLSCGRRLHLSGSILAI